MLAMERLKVARDENLGFRGGEHGKRRPRLYAAEK
jgi:hypothetical protein